MFNDNGLNLPQLVCSKTVIASKRNRLKPEFCRRVVAIDVDVWRLIQLVAPKIEPIRPDSQQGRHKP